MVMNFPSPKVLVSNPYNYTTIQVANFCLSYIKTIATNIDLQTDPWTTS